MPNPFTPFTMDTGAQPGVSYANMPPELQQQAAELARKRAISEAMMGQSFSPIQQQTVAQGRVVPIQPLEVIAKALMGGMAGRMDRQNQEGTAGLVKSYNTGLASEVQKFKTRAAGVEGDRDPQELEQNQDWGTPLPYKVAPDRKGAIEDAMMLSQYGPVRDYAKAEHAAELARENESMKTHTLTPGSTVTRNGVPLYTAPGKDPIRANKAIPANWKKHLPEGATAGPTPGTYVAKDGDTMQMKFEDGELVDSHNVNPMPTPKTNPADRSSSNTTIIDPTDSTKSLVINANLYKGGSIGSPGVLGYSPKESDVQKREGKRQFNMQGIGATLTSARNILEGKDGEPLPTGSGFGTALDYVASIGGLSPSGATEADQMRVLGGALTAKMPRMEGPQSDRDVVLYREMAARIGDPTVPVDRRLKALTTVEELWTKYEHLNPGAFASDVGSASSNNSPLTPAERARLEQLRKQRGAK